MLLVGHNVLHAFDANSLAGGQQLLDHPQHLAGNVLLSKEALEARIGKE